MIRLLLADDQALVRGALASLLGLEPDLEVVAEVGRGDEVVAAAREARPDVALLDVEMPGLDGLAATSALRAARPVLPGARGDDVRAARATCGARWRRARAGSSSRTPRPGSWPTPCGGCTPACGSSTRRWPPRAWPPGRRPLTARETDVLRAARDGGTVADLAAALHLSEGTVRNHLSSAIGKTGARTRAEAVRLADEAGWLL